MAIPTLKQAELYFRAGRKQDAIDLLELHMQRVPSDYRVAKVLGKVYQRAKRPDQAAHWLSVALLGSRQPVPLNDEDEKFDELGADELEYVETSAGYRPEWDFDHDYGFDNQQASVMSAPISEAPTYPQVEEDEERSAAVVGPSDTAEQKVQFKGAQGELDDDGVTSAGNDESYSAGIEEGVLIGDDDAFDQDAAALEDDSDYDWEEHALGDDQLVADDSSAISKTSNRIPGEQRARQVASSLAEEAGWDLKDLPVLIEVLVHHNCHGKTKSALRTLMIELKVTPEELLTLHEIRLYWSGSGYNRTFRGNDACDGWPSVSWPLCLRLLRQLEADSVEEVFLFVEDCFQNWNDSPPMISAYPIFSYYLNYLINHMAQVSETCSQRMPPFIDYDLFPDDDSYYDSWRLRDTEFRFGYSIISPERGWW